MMIQKLTLCDTPSAPDDEDNVGFVDSQLLLYLGHADVRKKQVVVLLNSTLQDFAQFHTIQFDKESKTFARTPSTKSVEMQVGEEPLPNKIGRKTYQISLVKVYAKADPSRLIKTCADFEIKWEIPKR